MHFFFLFSIKLRNLLNPQVAISIIRKHFVYHFRPPILASEINQNIICFRVPFLDTTFLILCYFSQKMITLGGGASKNLLAPKWDPQSTEWLKNGTDVLILFSPLCDPENAKACRNAKWIGPSFCPCSSLFCIL